MVSMYYIFGYVVAWVEGYRAWLKKGKNRAEKILCAPIAAIFLVVVFAPTEFFEWYFSSQFLALLAPVVILPLIPFYVVTYFHVVRKTN